MDASFAAGVERREERGMDVPDPLQLAGLHGGNKVPLTVGEYSVNGYYGELLVPLVQDLPLQMKLHLKQLIGLIITQHPVQLMQQNSV